ncbi:hypothetical protein [Psychromonas ossibalaenae]|uniref:hypothetical protein n=1 Tax=Psychromonas ossibalaenae TaxID=444922 RepID=UPI00037673B6|nr:hypothetical protein [Psychromonas ossibalaenae]
MNMTLSFGPPLLSLEEYARRTGITIDSVRNQIIKGQLPFIQHGTRGTRYINMVQLTQLCLEANTDNPHNKCSFN